MASRPDRSREPDEEPRGGSDLDLATLAVAATASAVAAYATSQLWPGGTLWSAAATPVIITLVKEALNRPATRLRTVAVQRPARRAGRGREPAAPEAEPTPVTAGGRSRLAGRRWPLALVTGLLAFAVVAVLYTVPELVAGRSLGAGGDKRTTLFGGRPAPKAPEPEPEPSPVPTPTPTGAAPVVTPVVTPSVTPTVTVVPTPTPTPSPSPSPALSPSPGPLSTP